MHLLSLIDEQFYANNTLKQALIEPPILALPRPDLLFSIDAHECEFKEGAALMNTHEYGSSHPICCWSRSLNPPEKI